MCFSFFGEAFIEAGEVEFRGAGEGKEAVTLLFDVGELGIAEAGDIGVICEGGGEGFEAGVEFLFGFGAVAVAPAVADVPADAAVFAYEDGAATIGLAVFEGAVVGHIIKIGIVGSEFGGVG